ncbi:MAG: Methyltransferase type 11 [Actinomycetia bacterium]|nr:Methyltransferase type 11 [Actinomycetes bacterium]
MALRRAGLGLGQIGALLTERDPDPAATLRTHLAQLEEDLLRRTELRDRLTAALGAYDDDGEGDAVLLMKVIETMTMFQQYVHGYQVEENLRLNDQASTLVDLLHDGTAYPPGSHVLEAGCGVGAQTVTLARRSPGAHVTAIDVSACAQPGGSALLTPAGRTRMALVVDGSLRASADGHGVAVDPDGHRGGQEGNDGRHLLGGDDPA